MTSERWGKIKEIFQAALERPAEERKGFLHESCEGDDSLRKEVEGLLAREGAPSLASPAVEMLHEACAAGSFEAGERVSHYEIEEKLGEGGMGAVYKARDTRLGRVVAIKLVNAEFTQRFEHEARAIAALNHPNICTLHDVGPNYLVMELVEGADLAGPVSVDIAIGYAGQIAAGLEAAHEKAIIHRDLKPANIKVTPDGTVKILDFGLAKAAIPASSAPSLTESGMILGTAAYMSPEQARGEHVDKRADIWAFGVVFYELLTGKQLFGSGNRFSEAIAAILTREPDFTALPKETPPHVRRLLEHCLRKDPKQRLHDIGDARLLLEEAVTRGPVPGLPIGGALSARRWIRIGAAAAVCALLALAVWIGSKWVNPGSKPPVYEFSVAPPRGEFFNRFTAGQISPDGRMMATITRAPGRGTLVGLHRFESGSHTPLAGSEGTQWLAWSPDSEHLAYVQGGKLLRVPIGGGVAQTLVEEAGTVADMPFSWGPGGYLIATDEKSKRLLLVSEKGGAPRLLGELDSSRGEISHGQPQLFPDGRRYLYFALSNKPENSGVYVDSIDAGQGKPASARTLVLASRSAAVLAFSSEDRLTTRPRGYLLTCRDDTLFANRFDLGSRRLEGEAIAVASQVYWDENFVGVSVSRTGTLMLAPLLREETEAVFFNRQGKELDISFPPGLYYTPAFSRDGTRIAISRAGTATGTQDLWICDLAKTSWSRLTSGAQWHGFGLWSRDDRELIYARIGPSTEVRTLYRRDADGLREPQKLLGPVVYPSPFDWSLDGRYLLYGLYRTVRPRGYDLWILPLEGGGDPYPFLESEHNARFGSFSPDGRFVAFSWSLTGKDEVYVRPLDQTKHRQWRISADGGTQPRWSRDGKQIYFLAAENKLMSVAVKVQGDEFEARTPVPLMSLPRIPYTFSGYLYDVSPRGELVVFIRADTSRGNPSVRVILNWEGLAPR